MSSNVLLQKYLQNPKQIGSITPSSRFLAKQMVQSVNWHEVSYVAELGSGTGAVTDFINARAHRSTEIFLFEQDQQMREKLNQRFPRANCYADACHLTDVLIGHGVQHLDCIISGLPFFNFEVSLRERLMDEVFNTLRTGGYFIAFQYSLQMKKQLEDVFDVEHIRFVPLNVPPAFVYVCRKR